MPAAPWLSWYRKEYLVEMFFNPFSTIIWCDGTPWILRWYARWVARQHGRFTFFLMGEAMFLFIASLIFCHFTIFTTQQVLVTRKGSNVGWKEDDCVSFRRYDTVPFLEIFITDWVYYGDPSTFGMNAFFKYYLIFICCKSWCDIDISRIMFTIMSQDLMGARWLYGIGRFQQSLL